MAPTKARQSRLGMIWFALALSALAILAIPSLAAAKDRNRDRIPDRWEKRHNLSLNVSQAGRDQDHDRLRNRAEFLAGDDPRDQDSDDDGIIDGTEQAGTIASFDEETGRLVIDLFGNDTIAGFVTDETKIECEDGGPSASVSSEDPVDEEGDEPTAEPEGSGEGEGEPGDDQESDDDADRPCTTAALVPGAVVEEAELELANGRATFEEVELSGNEV